MHKHIKGNFSTQNHVVLEPPELCAKAICTVRLRSEALSKVSEGGLRLKGLYKKTTPLHPLVTVITVVYNRANTIEDCIRSVCAQSYCNIEYIVIDGASTDGTVNVIERYKDAIDYFVSEQDNGIYDAMNKGLGLASGDYILFLNSDDWYHEQAVQYLMNQALMHDSDVTHADIFRVSQRGFILGRLNGWLDDSLYTTDMPIRHETMLVKKQIYNTFGGYNTNFNIIADYDFVIRLYKSGCRFRHVPQALLFFRVTGYSSTQLNERRAERKKLFVRMYPFLDDLDAGKLAKGLTHAECLALMEKYKNTSQHFVKSMTYSIARSPIGSGDMLRSLYKTKFPIRPFLDMARWGFQYIRILRYMCAK